MKRIIYITGIIIILGLIVSGCADRPQEIPTQDVDHKDTPNVSLESNVSSVTQEDLDKLKADIENLEAEDLGGLSND